MNQRCVMARRLRSPADSLKCPPPHVTATARPPRPRRQHWLRCLTAAALAFAALSSPAGADDVFDRIERALTWSHADAQVRARLSGLLDLEGYAFDLPPPILVHAKSRRLFNPRLTLFLDGQLGPRTYVFAQSRIDRGFDPARRDAEIRLDEYAVRFALLERGRLNIQLGKFATVVGNWAPRHDSWTNPFITAPLPYEYLTGMWDNEVPRSANSLLQWSHVRPGLAPNVAAIEKTLRLPILWGPSYATGVAASGRSGDLNYAVEVKQGSLSSRPKTWHRFDEYINHPTVSGRLGYDPSPRWNFGVSASAGTYLRPIAASTIPTGLGRGDFRQLVLAHDLAFAWRHLQVWAEIFATRFEVPGIGDADTVAYYTEAKYKFTPRLYGALRWNQQLFGSIPERGASVKWGQDVWRMDVGPTLRLSPHVQMKLQYSLQHGDAGARQHSRAGAAQLTVRF